MKNNVYYKTSVSKDLKKFPAKDSKKIIHDFEGAIKAGESGEALKGSFQGMYKFRVGDYRVIYCPYQDGILVLRINHRKDAYR